MRKVDRSALVPYEAEQMFLLVDDVTAYPQFLPWCIAAEEHERTDQIVEATLELQKGKLRKSFRTRNTRREFESIELALVGGPFKTLSGGWQFTDLGGGGCKVGLNLEFEFDSKVADMMFGAFFEETCNSLVDAFVRRANAIHASDRP